MATQINFDTREQDLRAMSKVSNSIELEERQVQYLQQIVDKYALMDMGKAVRCLIDHAVSNPEIESEVFQEIRCLDC